MKTTPLTRVIAALLAAPLAMTPALAQELRRRGPGHRAERGRALR